MSTYLIKTKEEIYKLCIEEAAKSPCEKRKVGAILTRQCPDTQHYVILSTGHNHNPNGLFCEGLHGETLEEVIHAEQACMNNYVNKLFNTSDSYIMFVTHDPCPGCLATLAKYNIMYEVVGEFLKFDKTKLRMSLVPASLSQACARALQYGARKYKVGNWRKTPDIECYISAMQRHFDAWREGEEIDVDKFDDKGNLIEKGSGLSHLDHMAANLAFLIELKHLPKIKDESIKL